MFWSMRTNPGTLLTVEVVGLHGKWGEGLRGSVAHNGMRSCVLCSKAGI